MRRRAARIARPARVRMRRRKPCVFARRRLFGWKVRLLTVGSPGLGCAGEGHAKHAHHSRGPYEVTHPADGVQIRVHPGRATKINVSLRDTAERHAVHVRMFAIGHVLWHSPTLVSVRALGWRDGSGSPCCATDRRLNLRRFPVVHRTFVHSCGQPCGCRVGNRTVRADTGGPTWTDSPKWVDRGSLPHGGTGTTQAIRGDGSNRCPSIR